MELRFSKYKWVSSLVKELAPGKAYLALRGKEFECEPISFTNTLYRIAREQGWKVTTITFDTCVVYAFYLPTSYLRPNLAAYPVVKKMRNE